MYSKSKYAKNQVKIPRKYLKQLNLFYIIPYAPNKLSQFGVEIVSGCKSIILQIRGLMKIIILGLPLIIVLAWSVTVSFENSEFCWKNFGKSSSVWILTGPMISSLIVSIRS